MPFTYDVALTNERDQVRFLIQDITESTALFQDEEIDWILTQEANVYNAAAALCDVRVTQVGGNRGVKRKKVGDLDITYDAGHWSDLSAKLRARGMGNQVPYAGGVTVSDKDAQKADANWVKPSIPRGINDNPGAPKPEQPSSNPLTAL